MPSANGRMKIHADSGSGAVPKSVFHEGVSKGKMVDFHGGTECQSGAA
jgi:hypothetical protein